MNRTLNLCLLAALAAMYALPTLAADAAKATEPATLMEAITMGKPMTNFRLRYENVDQDGKSENANAWTLRSLIGWQTQKFNNFSFAGQIIGVTPFNDQYNDLKNGVSDPSKVNYPVVADPENYGVNQLFMEWSGIPDTTIRAGRQSVKLDNVRFVGNVEFRQVMQVFDGIALENKSLPNTDIYLAHFEKVKQISTKLQDANIEMANIKYKFTPTESLVGYGYLVDWNASALEANSSQTYGLRLDGARKVSDDWKVLYTAEYAKQDDYKGGSALIDNHYYHVGAGAGFGKWFARVDQELLSGNGQGKAFQTPLGTNHLFQGWADVFLTTPNEGIRDTFITAGGKLMDVDLKAEYHWIDSDRDFAKIGGGLGSNYGNEFDVSAAYAYNKQVSGKIEYANFQEEDQYKTTASRKRDIEKLWLTVMYSF